MDAQLGTIPSARALAVLVALVALIAPSYGARADIVSGPGRGARGADPAASALSGAGPSGPRAARVVGADLSFVPELQSLGAEFRVGGEPVDPLEAFHDHGHRLVRLRLWHTPDEPWQGLDATVAHAVAAKLAGHEIMLDIHYSDTWADPAHQTKPAAWQSLAFPALVDSVYAYTNAVIRRFRDEGVVPSYVQIGNEISSGLLWSDGRVGGAWDTPGQWDKLGTLLSTGAAAVRDSLDPSERPLIVIHVDNGGSNGLCRWFFDNVVAEGVDFDIIAVSFYPWWHGTLPELEYNLHDLAATYGKGLMVVETAYPWTLDWYDGVHNFVGSADQLHPGYPASPEGQLAFLEDLLDVVEGVPGDLGLGVIYWEPGFLSVPGGPGNPYENLTLFDFDGDALPGLSYALFWGTDVPGGDDGHGLAPLLSPGVPNPFAFSTSLAFTVPSGGAEVDVGVYDVSGRQVASLASGHRAEGVHRLAWSGRADGGSDLSTGVYFCRAEVGGRSEMTKLVLIR
ncbi:MAG: glycosyl hydrolase 53 family protein [Candidatus Eisenbacteria bacterium]